MNIFNIISFISKRHQGKEIVLSPLSERRKMRVFQNVVLGLGVGSNPGPHAPKVCVLPMRHWIKMPLHPRLMHQIDP
jgi:hypothetical protein